MEKNKHLAEPFFFEGKVKIGILLVHGFTASPTEMLPLGKFLSEKGYTVYGVRLAGHGTDVNELATSTWEEWYESVKEGVQKLGNMDIIIPIGLSAGALLCTLLCQEEKGRFPALVLLAPALEINSRLAKLAGILKFFVKFTYKGEETKQYFEKHNLYSYMYRPTASVHELLKLIKKVWKGRMLNIPTLMIYGKKDELVSFDGLKKSFNKLYDEKRTTLIELKNSGHILTVESDHEKLFNSVFEFIKEF